MIKFLRVLSLLCLLAVVVFWLTAGANRGWTKTSVAIAQVDPVTEIEFVEYEPRFVPGVDFLALGSISAGTLFFLSLIIQKLSHKKNS